MTLSIHGDIKTGVVSPNQRFEFELRVRGEDNGPAPGMTVRITLDPAAGVSLVDPPQTTDGSGKVRLSLRAGAAPGRATIKASIDQGPDWEGNLVVTTLRISTMAAIKLTPVEERLLQILYWDKDRLQILDQFGGYSNSRVLKVQTFDSQGPCVPQIIKFGARDRMSHEGGNYRKWFQDRLPNAARIREFAELGLTGAVIYEDAHESGNLDRVVPLAKFFNQNATEDITAALYSILEKGMRRVYRYFRVRPLTYRDLFGGFLFENLVVSLQGGKSQLGVYRSGRHPAASPETTRLDPKGTEIWRFSLAVDDIVLLENHRISRVEKEYLNLQDKEERYKVKVLMDRTSALDFAPEDEVDIVARFITDHERRLQFAVEDGFKKQGATVTEEQVQFDSEIYPNPLRLLESTLDRACDVAWGTIHGDFHWENIMLEGPANWWLIDYELTREGPILFDFVRLELFLRFMILTREPNLKPAQILAFEQDLMDNPLGRLPPRKIDVPALQKAADAIRAIRRMARPYLAEDLFDYWRILFISSITLGKFYPLRERWEAADANHKALQYVAHEVFVGMAPALVIGRALLWEDVRSRRPHITYQFVPLGQVLQPEPRTVALDVGNRDEPGVIDHHGGGGTPDCTASLVMKHPEWLTSHLVGIPPEEVTWTVHEGPDFDCVASAYLAWHRVNLGFFPPGAQGLADYSLEVDRGGGFLDRVPFPERTPYGLFVLYLNRIDPASAPLPEVYRQMMQSGFEIMDFLCRLEVRGFHAMADNLLPHEHDFLKATRRDRDLFDRFDFPLADKVQVPLRLDGHKKQVSGLVMRSPRSQLFKAWARKGEYPVLVVLWPQPHKTHQRILVSVPPTYTNALRGLGKALEQAETAKRNRLEKQRQGQPRWPDVDNDDPWYDGRSLAHSFTIVDSPREGTVLDLAEVVHILLEGGWIEREKD